MNIRNRLPKRRFSRHLLTAVIVFCVMFLYREFVLPLSPGLDTQPTGALVAGAVAVVAWWIVSRGRRS